MKTQIYCKNIGKGGGCGWFWITLSSEQAQSIYFDAECPKKCGGFAEMYGRLNTKKEPNEDVVCTDSRCRTSESRRCNCSCGGSHHGTDVLMVGKQ
jgi:hypothetical protein